MKLSQTAWSPKVGELLKVARRLSHELGHNEIIFPLHLFLGMVTEVRPPSLEVPRPTPSTVVNAMLTFAPPWEGAAVLSPGGQTPTTKRILERAVEKSGGIRSADVEQVWAALVEIEPELVRIVLSLLDSSYRGEVG